MKRPLFDLFAGKLVLLLLFFTASCGEKQVKFPVQPVSTSQVTQAGRLQLQQAGVFVKHQTINGTTIRNGSLVYYLSEYSSQQALSFYASKPIGVPINVKFRGEVVRGKLVVELIEDL